MKKSNVNNNNENNNNKKYVTPKSFVYAVHMRIYAEQLGYTGAETDFESMRDFMAERLKIINTLSPKGCGFYIDSAIHYDDYGTAADDIETPHLLKTHGHLIVVSTQERPDGQLMAVRFEKVLKFLKDTIGFEYREKTDINERKHIIRISMRGASESSLPAFIAYQRHNTYDAIEAGKRLYAEIGVETYRYTNDIERSRELENRYIKYHGYQRNDNGEIIINTNDVKLSIYDRARSWGNDGKPLKDFMVSLPDIIKIGDYDKLITRAYDEGLDYYLNTSSASLDHTRCSIYIYGKPGVGKTHNSLAVCRAIAGETMDIQAGSTGKFDDVSASTRALVVSDTSLGKLDNYFCIPDDNFTRIYRRNSGNPLWVGDYLVITYNRPFDEYMSLYASGVWGTDLDNNPAQREALRSRFYICYCDETGLHLERPRKRGSIEKQAKNAEMFRKFYESFNVMLRDFIAARNNPPADRPESLRWLDSITQPLIGVKGNEPIHDDIKINF